jgi:hypothetical protein
MPGLQNKLLLSQSTSMGIDAGMGIGTTAQCPHIASIVSPNSGMK